MKSILFLLILLLSAGVVKADANYYQGLVFLNIGSHKYGDPQRDPSAQFSDTIVFRFFSNPGDKEPVRQLSCYKIREVTPYEVIIESDYRTWFSPMVFKTDSLNGHYSVHLTCVSQKGDWLEVVVNEQTQSKMWIKRGSHVRFDSWAHISGKKYYSISTSTTVYEKADTNSTPVNVAVNCFTINGVSGDWMRISTGKNDLCDSRGKKTLTNVWVRFRTPDKLLITIDTN